MKRLGYRVYVADEDGPRRVVKTMAADMAEASRNAVRRLYGDDARLQARIPGSEDPEERLGWTHRASWLTTEGIVTTVARRGWVER